MSKLKVFLIAICILLVLAITAVALYPALVKSIYINKFGQENYDRFIGLQTGDYVTLGTYEQDRDLDNGAEPIEWVVLAVENHKALLVSRYVLDCVPYSKSDGNVTWENSYIRQWLNDKFLNEAFTQPERAMIPEMEIVPDKGMDDEVNPQPVTYDQVFLLSHTDVNLYFTSNEERRCQATSYAKWEGIMAAVNDGTCWWWLRTAGNKTDYAAYVLINGYAYSGGGKATEDFIGVRPAIWVELPRA